MSRFFSSRHAALTPYTPGEQPQDRRYIKLNTNESPYPPAQNVRAAVAAESEKLALYSDPEQAVLCRALAARYHVAPAQVLVTNGSDEGLEMAFLAFADESHPLCFPDITYGFYSVFAALYHIPFQTVPLREDFTIDAAAYPDGHTVVIANPNAPTGLSLPLEQIEDIAGRDRDRIVIVDEAYIDFGGQSALPLVDRYDNVLVVRTFSKSRSMAGARLGFCIGNEALIRDLNTLKYSKNPYNVNRLTAAAGLAALENDGYYMDNCRAIRRTREHTRERLEALGFTVLPSDANFLFARTPKMAGGALYGALKEKGILVRHFDAPRISDFNRITVGTPAEMDALIKTIKEILEEQA